MLVCGWTGYVMVWDEQGQVLARASSTCCPSSRSRSAARFVGERPIPGAFFFLNNLFAHIAIPIGFGLLVWLHVSRVARPALLPPRGLMLGGMGLLFALPLAWPAAIGPKADLFRLPALAPFDWFYNFWLLSVTPGTHAIVVTFTREGEIPWGAREDEEGTPARVTLDTAVALSPRQVLLVTYDDDSRGLVVRLGSASSETR